MEVCTVDCIVPGPKDDPVWDGYFYIDRGTCIECGVCIPVCPPDAIFPACDVPEEYIADIQMNDDFFSKGPGYWDFDLEEQRKFCIQMRICLVCTLPCEFARRRENLFR